MQRNKLSINEYSMKVKSLADSLGSIGAPVDDEDLVSVTLNGLGREYAQFRTSIGVRDLLSTTHFVDRLNVLSRSDFLVFTHLP